jgi:hypothetical protein
MGHDNLVKRRYKPTMEAVEVSGINWHSLRHYAISTWIEAKLAPKTVQTGELNRVGLIVEWHCFTNQLAYWYEQTRTYRY